MNKILLSVTPWLLALVFSAGLMLPAGAQTEAVPVPKLREVSQNEQLELSRSIESRFGELLPLNTRFSGGGAFRFVESRGFLYFDRTDTGSLAFERPEYGAAEIKDPANISEQVLLPTIDDAVAKIGLAVDDKVFYRFQDEYAAAAQPKLLPEGFDPRKAGRLMARTAAYVREIDRVPVFGSELLIGLLSDGRIGRLRVHWPYVDPRLVEDARLLQESVAAGSWQIPAGVFDKNTKILEVQAGVGHSAFADPGFRIQPVVRVLYRTRSEDLKYPLQTTGYRYFSAEGTEVALNLMPIVAASPAESKKALQ